MNRQLYSATCRFCKIKFWYAWIFVARTLMLHTCLMILRSLYQLTEVVLYVYQLSTQVFFWTHYHDKYFILFLRRYVSQFAISLIHLGIYQVSAHEAFNELHHSSYLWQDKGFFRASSKIVPDYWFTNS